MSEMPPEAYRLPSIYVDKLNVMVGANGMGRLTFGTEQPDGSIVWHIAVALTNGNVESLYNTLGKVLQQHAGPKGKMQ